MLFSSWFSFFMNDLLLQIKTVQLNMYAEDGQLDISNTDLVSLEGRWYKSNRVIVNVSNYQAMLLGNTEHHFHFSRVSKGLGLGYESLPGWLWTLNGASKFWMPNTDWLKLIARWRQSSVIFRCKRIVNWWTGMYCWGKQEINVLILTWVLEIDHRDAVPSWLHGQDVVAVLPTGFGKSLIFQVFAIEVEMERERVQTALVLCALLSIINDRISEARNMGFSAS